MATDFGQTVRGYVNTVDITLLKLIKAFAESYQKNVPELSLREEQYQLIDKRREANLKGENKTFTWEELKQNARNSC